MIIKPVINPLSKRQMLDAVFYEISLQLAPLPWINDCFGKAQRRVKKLGNQDFFYPALHDDSGEYLDLSPNDNFGNFIFFDIEDGQQIPINRNEKISSKVGLVFFGSFKNIYDESVKSSIENVKLLLLNKLQNSAFRLSQFRVTRIYEKLENIYKGYSLKETDSQFLMYPYFALRFELDLKYYANNCNVQLAPILNISDESEINESETGQTFEIEIGQNGFRYIDSEIAIWLQTVESKIWHIPIENGTTLKAETNDIRIDDYNKYLKKIIEKEKYVELHWKLPMEGEATLLISN